MIFLALNPRFTPPAPRYYAQRCHDPAYTALGLDFVVTEGREPGAQTIGYYTSYAYALATAQALNRQREQVAHEPIIMLARPEVSPRSN